MVEIPRLRAVEGVQDPAGGIAVTLGQAVGKQRGGHDDHLLVGEGGAGDPAEDQGRLGEGQAVEQAEVVETGDKFLRGDGEDEGTVDEIAGIGALQEGSHQGSVPGDGDGDFDFAAFAQHGQGHGPVAGHLLDAVFEGDPDIVRQDDHAFVVDAGVPDLGDDIPDPKRVGRVIGVHFAHHHALGIAVQLEKGAQGRIDEGLKFVEVDGLAVVPVIGDVGEEEVDLLVGDDVADVVAATQPGEGQADHAVVDQGGTAAVAGVDGRIDLDPQTRARVIVGGELDARDDALGDGEGGAAGGIAVGHDRVLDAGQGLGARQGRAGVEEGLVVEFEHGEIHGRGEGLDGGGVFVARLVGLHLDLAGVDDDVGVGEDAVAGDDDPGARAFPRGLLRPRPVNVGEAGGGENLHHGVFNRRGAGRGGLTGKPGRAGQDQERAEGVATGGEAGNAHGPDPRSEAPGV